MDAKLFLAALAVWGAFAVAGILNGVFRESFLAPKVSEHASHVLSTLVLVGVIFAGSFLFLLVLANLEIDYSKADLVLVGVVWVVLTVVFEFGFGHFVAGNSWSTLLTDYNLLNGRVWSLVLLAVFVAPSFWGCIFQKI
ncbi:MAG: hypothetical protein ACXQT6_02570 [Candidatus Methanospirareceae archaeon]|nr:hypothetical protein [Methanophagales archaeon]PXF51158.1 MAG: hypothetical protein C4B55_01740 [Methanophagales archaeon]HDN68747.1 hypothetical protein [Methanomicrobia archaeon]